jgi:heme exporter protein A
MSVGVLIFDADAAALLKVEQLGYRRGDEWLFRNLSFEIRPGQMLWLRGQNGRGKTSLLRLLVELARPDEGTVSWAHGLAEEPRRRLYLGHSNALKEDLTALESLQFLAQLAGCNRSTEQLVAAMRRLAIHQRRHQPVRTLSQGQRRRVALSRLALEDAPSLWVLDEPFESLDSQGMASVHALMHEHLARKGSLILTSHIPIHLDDANVAVLDLDKVGMQ